MVDKLLEGNKIFLLKDFHRNKNHYERLNEGQTPHTLVIGCSDSRVNVERIFRAEMGEIFVHRNIGNIVAIEDPNLGAVLEYALNYLDIDYLVVCGHSECGAMKALNEDKKGNYLSQWLIHAKEAKEYVESLGLPDKTPEDRKEKQTLLEKENLKIQVKNLYKYDFVKKSVEKGDIIIKGIYYSLETGNVEEII
ncbi:MAG: carbonic anhydrase [Methanomicrobium sp.]|nr:carbonic anhydrase [Methanomicrobium sp.]